MSASHSSPCSARVCNVGVGNFYGGHTHASYRICKGCTQWRGYACVGPEGTRELLGFLLNSRVGGLGPAHLVHIPPVASIIVAASNHKQLVEEGSHAVPGPSNRPVSQSMPCVASWVVAMRLFQVVLSSATTGNVHLPLQRGACMGIHLFGAPKKR